MAEDKNIKGKRGGARPGAGRPRSATSKLQTFRALKEVAAYLDKQENKTSVINASLLRYMHEKDVAQQNTAMSNLGTIIPATSFADTTAPFFDVKLVAGYPLPLDNDAAAEDLNVMKLLSPDPESSYLIKVRGSSMIDANINDGDLLVVDRNRQMSSEKSIFVCEFNGEYTVKYVREIDGKLCLVPANPKFPVIPIGENDELNIWGTITYIIHKAN